MSEKSIIEKLTEILRQQEESTFEKELIVLSEYFKEVSINLKIEKHSLLADPELLSLFETVYLFLSERLLFLPSSLRKQIEDIIVNNDLCEYLSGLASLAQEGELPPRGIFNLFASTPFYIRSAGIELGITKEVTEERTLDISDRKLFAIRTLLHRLSRIVEYAASHPQVQEFYNGTEAFSTNYNFNIINPHKVVVLINLLKLEIENIPNVPKKSQLLKQLEEVESEIRKGGKTRWPMVVAWFFIAFGFFADLKTLDPQSYDKSYRIVSQIIGILHSEGQVNKPEASSEEIRKLELPEVKKSVKEDP